MHQGHENHGAMTPEMIVRHHYQMLGANLLISEGIIASQTAEIAQMKAILDRGR